MKNDDKIYQDYIKVCDQISDLKSKKEVLHEMVMKKLGKLEEVETPNGMITKYKRARWVYPNRIKHMILDVKFEARKAGVAKLEESEYLRITLR